jgi:hypothetical protein
MRLLKNVASVIAVLAVGIFLLSVLVKTEALGYPNMGANCAGCHGGKVPGAQPAPKPAPTKPAPTKPAPTKPAPSKPATPAPAPSAFSAAARTETFVLNINGVTRPVDLVLEQGTAYVKVRDLEKYFKVSIEWNPANRTAAVRVGNDTFTVGTKDNTVGLNGETKKLNKPLKLVSGGLWLPLREVVVAAGGTVSFDPLWGINVEIPALSVKKAP